MDLMNKVLLAGNLTRDPEARRTGTGKSVTELTLAIDPPGKAKNQNQAGDQQGARDETIFVDVVFWERTAENAAEYLHKGSAVLVEGRLRMDSWEDRETGKIRRKLKVAGERLKFLNLAPAGGSERDRDREGKSKSSGREREYADERR